MIRMTSLLPQPPYEVYSPDDDGDHDDERKCDGDDEHYQAHHGVEQDGCQEAANDRRRNHGLLRPRFVLLFLEPEKEDVKPYGKGNHAYENEKHECSLCLEESVGFEPTDPVSRADDLASRCLKPLSQLSRLIGLGPQPVDFLLFRPFLGSDLDEHHEGPEERRGEKRVNDHYNPEEFYFRIGFFGCVLL